MKILAIDTSCDDTCVALLKIKNRKLEILSNLVSSQVKLHAKYGGVYPSLAKREHQKNLPIIFKKALRRLKKKQFDLIGVTIGPGLEPCLWQGVNFAKDLAKKLGKPLVLINHIEAHILANWLSDSMSHISDSKCLFPAVSLVVSGGHTQLILMRGVGKYKLLGETRDDAAGECFDKVAKILGLSYPGGPVIDAEAAKYRSRLKDDCRIPKYRIGLPRPMIYQKNYDFSFSGLKTAVLYDFRSRSLKIRKSKEYIQEMAAEAQQAIIDVLISKTVKVAKKFRSKTIILGGGVSASQELRNRFKSKCLTSGIKLLVPSKNLSTDNAVMVAITSYCHRKTATKNLKRIKADANLRI
ncbi:MAG TPA: tRNA (adenosine(37)-N6)-threonylcarbamoyltransferase complex transferase subunit TsaD [Candidatus Humimicrobiaceae bacterium]|nr:tRNA (adenosine(37)-N6)-threonylcarbamoyltransferase complex transferase subunit TsaD [Candidatus Humimicrobiaceae bacterium]